MNSKTSLKRVDLQVAILVTVLVVFSSLVVFFFAYTLSYNQMIASLEDRVNAIALYVDSEIPTNIFSEISTAKDMSTPAYLEAQNFLSNTRRVSSAQYIYTATCNENNELIYHIDGLPTTDPDFRKPGDLIEPDFQEDLKTALTDTIVMPGDIKNTEWGDVFVAYYPLHDEEDNTVIGALGLEFPANREYEAFRFIRTMTPFVIFLTCVIAFFVSRVLFRRISNPHFKDLSNTDSLTGLKNRNAFELDIENLISANRTKRYAVLLADLNSLKVVNDQLGHKLGDEYLKNLANAIESQTEENRVPYRIGGDEFAVFFFNPTDEEIAKYIRLVRAHLKEHTEEIIPFCSVAVGFALGGQLTHESWEKTYTLADSLLYQDKKTFYENNRECNNRK